MPSVQSVLDQLALGVQEVDDSVGVCLVAGSEDHELELLPQLLQQFLGVGPDINRGQHGVPPWKGDRYLNLMFFSQLFKAMDQSLIEIEHYCDFVYI